MPPRSRVTNGESRGRQGCWTCKEKHVRCTGEQPCCARCQRLNLSCSYELKLLWQEDAVQRGICLGREGRWSKHGKAKERIRKTAEPVFFTPKGDFIFLNATNRHFEPSVDDKDFDADNRSEYEPELLPVASRERSTSAFDLAFENNSNTSEQPTSLVQYSPSAFPLALPPREAYLYNYFVSVICPSCSLSAAHNPYLRYITPMSFSYPPLQNAIISVSANQLRLINDHRFEAEAWSHKVQTLQGLQTTIASGEVSWPFIATILMLCFYDISDGCNESWMTHLRGGLSVMNQLETNFTESQALRKFCSMYFIAHHIMGNTAAVSTEPDEHYSWLEDDSTEEIDPLMGCSRGLLDIIHRISRFTSDTAAILKKRPLAEAEVSHLTSTRNDFDRSLHTVRQVPPPASDSEYLSQIAEVKRITTLLYLHERVSALLPPSARSTHTLAPYKARLIDSLVEKISPLQNSPTLLWPLFVLGNASPEDEEHRRFVLERLNTILKSRNLGSVRLAMQLVEDKYRSWDLELEGDMKPKGKWISLA